jgi:hypothetical protein
LIQDEHPLFGIPALTIHPCGLEERLSLLVQLTTLDTSLSPELYLLQWFSLIGPIFDFQLTPPFFSQAKEILLSSVEP